MQNIGIGYFNKVDLTAPTQQHWDILQRIIFVNGGRYIGSLFLSAPFIGHMLRK